MILQAVIDDSGKGQGPVFILAGFVLSVDQWIAFADRWQDILDLPPRIEYFKMKEAAHCNGQFSRFSTTQKDKRVQEFVSLIMSYQPQTVRHVIPHDVYHALFKGKLAKGMDYPYFLAYYGVIGAWLRHQYSAGKLKDKTDFVFDEQGKESDMVQRGWDVAMRDMPKEVKPLMGGRPVHRDEKIFLPLQAADMFAWQCRRFYMEQSHGREYTDPVWKALSTLTCAEDEMTKERLAKIFSGIRTSGLLFEYDVPPRLQKLLKRVLRERFEKYG